MTRMMMEVAGMIIVIRIIRIIMGMIIVIRIIRYDHYQDYQDYNRGQDEDGDELTYDAGNN